LGGELSEQASSVMARDAYTDEVFFGIS